MTMTSREIFNKVKTHLLTQREKAQDSDGEITTCKLKDSKGLKCAVGCLITDDQYIPELENKSLPAVVRHIGLEEHVRLLTALQNVHDGYSVQYWERELDIVEERYF